MAGTTMFVVHQLVVCLLLWTSVVDVLPTTVTTTNLAFEAAFQGSCVEKNPCEQTCFDLHDGTFECGCHPGFVLLPDGYSCKVGHSSYDDDDEEETSTTPMSIRLEHLEPVVIDGRKSSPLKTMSHVRDGGIDSLGVVDSERHTLRKPASTSTPLATMPTVYVTDVEIDDFDDGDNDDDDDDDDDVENWDDTDEDEIDETEDHVGFEGTFDEHHYANYDDIMMEAKSSSSSREPNYESLGNRPTSMQTSTISNDNFAEEDDDVDDDESDDVIRTLCDRFQCEGDSICVPSSGASVSGDGDFSGVQCLCPLGRSGQHCEKYVEVRFPKFHGKSYMTLPNPKNAFKDLQLTLEFRPETPHGLLIYAGQHADASGDYVMVVIVDGHLEFRFDCGSGPSIIRSQEAVVLHQWNKAVVIRHRWDAWIQLNGGERVQGRSRGLFSRMTLSENLYLGGVSNVSSMPTSKVATRQGLDGCVRYLEINGRTYDFRPSSKGDAISGLAIDECSAEVCNNVDCKNGGKCIANSADSALCLCPLGFGGDYCETVVDLVMPYFNGTSYLKYPGLGSSVLSFVELHVTFKPVDPDGVFFYNGGPGSNGAIGSDGDFVSLSLSGCFVELRFDLGTGPAVLRSMEPVSLHEWHTVFISRTGRDGILEVDSQPRVEGMARGAFTQLSLPHNLYVGGVPTFDHVSTDLGVHSSFRGCIQKIHINDKPLKLFEAALVGVNVENCNHPCVNRPCLNHGLCSPRKEYFSCHCLLGFADARCQTEIKENITSPMFVGNSFLRYTRPEILRRIMGDGFDIRLSFRTLSSDGLLLWTGRRDMTAMSDFVAVALQAGHVHLRYNLGSGEVIIEGNETRVDDGGWHTVKAIRTNKEGSLSVDSGPVITMESPGFLTQVNTDTGLYLGGVPNIVQLTVGKYSSGFMGCVSEFQLDADYAIHLVSHAQGGLNVESCV